MRAGNKYGEDSFQLMKVSDTQYLPVYCDMTTAKGGFTLIVTSAHNNWTRAQVPHRQLHIILAFFRLIRYEAEAQSDVFLVMRWWLLKGKWKCSQIAREDEMTIMITIKTIIIKLFALISWLFRKRLASTINLLQRRDKMALKEFKIRLFLMYQQK